MAALSFVFVFLHSLSRCKTLHLQVGGTRASYASWNDYDVAQCLKTVQSPETLCRIHQWILPSGPSFYWWLSAESTLIRHAQRRVNDLRTRDSTDNFLILLETEEGWEVEQLKLQPGTHTGRWNCRWWLSLLHHMPTLSIPSSAPCTTFLFLVKIHRLCVYFPGFHFYFILGLVESFACIFRKIGINFNPWFLWFQLGESLTENTWRYT